MKYKVALMGNPIEHSVLPEIYKFLGKAFNIELDFDLIDSVRSDNKDALLFEVLLNEYHGVHIAYPLKHKAAEWIGSSVDSVTYINRTSGHSYGYNTDGKSIHDVIEDIIGTNHLGPRHKILILGTGATATVIYNRLLRAYQPPLVYMLSRAKDIFDKEEQPFFERSVYGDGLTGNLSKFNILNNIPEGGFHIIINATSCVDEVPFKDIMPILLANTRTFLDVNYRGTLPLIKMAKDMHIKAWDGTKIITRISGYAFSQLTDRKIPLHRIIDKLEDFKIKKKGY